jgi:uncharacterized protein YjgD (DUF1641 family)
LQTRGCLLCAAILSHLIDLLESTTKKSEVIDKIKKKFERVPNTGFLDIWLHLLQYLLLVRHITFVFYSEYKKNLSSFLLLNWKKIILNIF